MISLSENSYIYLILCFVNVINQSGLFLLYKLTKAEIGIRYLVLTQIFIAIAILLLFLNSIILPDPAAPDFLSWVSLIVTIACIVVSSVFMLIRTIINLIDIYYDENEKIVHKFKYLFHTLSEKRVFFFISTSFKLIFTVNFFVYALSAVNKPFIFFNSLILAIYNFSLVVVRIITHIIHVLNVKKYEGNVFLKKENFMAIYVHIAMMLFCTFIGVVYYWTSYKEVIEKDSVWLDLFVVLPYAIGHILYAINNTLKEKKEHSPYLRVISTTSFVTAGFSLIKISASSYAFLPNNAATILIIITSIVLAATLFVLNTLLMIKSIKTIKEL